MYVVVLHLDVILFARLYRHESCMLFASAVAHLATCYMGISNAWTGFFLSPMKIIVVGMQVRFCGLLAISAGKTRHH